MARSIEVLAQGGVWPEGPRWRDGALWYSDIGSGEVCRVTGPGQKEIYLSGMATPSGLGWTRSGDLLVVSIHDGALYRVGPDRVPKVLCGHERHGVDGTNDMATVGSWSYITCSGWHYEPGADPSVMANPIGKIVMVDHDTGDGRVVAEGMRMPNGCAVTPDGKQLLVAEVYGNRVTMFDIQSDGSLANHRLFADTGKSLDGLALDEAGAVWVATGEDFRRVEPGGKVTDIVEVPGWMCIAPMLGGEDGRTLFMAVTQTNGVDEIFAGKGKGEIHQTRVTVPAAAQPG
jgi:sugar lactone lactonase YvrE